MGRLIEDLREQKEVAVDTEADSFYSYHEKVCLVQITVEERDYLVDPLAPGVDLAPLGEVLADPDTVKVFHDSEYDVLLMKRVYGFRFANLFDTRVAAATLGTQSPGLASVIEAQFGVQLDKSQQRSNWSKRPLTEQQIRYARLDTHYLLPLMRALRTQLEERGRMMVLESECRRLEALESVEPAFRPDDFVRVKGVRTLTPVERQALRELFALRDTLARESNAPPFRVMNNQVLLELARRRPRNEKRLGAVHGFSPRMVRRFGDQVLAALERARELGPLRKLPSLPKRDGTEGLAEVEVELFDRLKRWRKRASETQGIESSYLLNRHVMSRLAQVRPQDESALAGTEGLCPWQLEMFGEELLEIVADFERDVAAGAIPRERPWRRRR